jgi:hypothetical protein
MKILLIATLFVVIAYLILTVAGITPYEPTQFNYHEDVLYCVAVAMVLGAIYALWLLLNMLLDFIESWRSRKARPSP